MKNRKMSQKNSASLRGVAPVAPGPVFHAPPAGQWAVRLGASGGPWLLAVVCHQGQESTKCSALQHAIGICEEMLGQADTMIVEEVVSYDPQPGQLSTICSITAALSEMSLPHFDCVRFVVVKTTVHNRDLRAMGVAWNNQGLKRASRLALALSHAEAVQSVRLMHGDLRKLGYEMEVARKITWPALSSLPQEFLEEHGPEAPAGIESWDPRNKEFLEAAGPVWMPLHKKFLEELSTLSDRRGFAEVRSQRSVKEETSGEESENGVKVAVVLKPSPEFQRSRLRSDKRSRADECPKARKRRRTETAPNTPRCENDTDDSEKCGSLLEHMSEPDTDTSEPEIVGLEHNREKVSNKELDKVLQILAQIHQSHSTMNASQSVKQEQEESESGNSIGNQTCMPRHVDLSGTQQTLVVSLTKDCWKYDPARTADALQKQESCLQIVLVNELRFTHAEINGAFRHAPHQGVLVSDTAAKLKNHECQVEDLPALVVMTFEKQKWVIMGNRRLKALKEFQDAVNYPVEMKCIVYDLDTNEPLPSPPCLMAKFIEASSTMNDGKDAAVRHGPRHQHWTVRPAWSWRHR